jgi:hypothetical protein
MIQIVLFFLIITISTCIIIGILAYTRMYMGERINSSIIDQPYSSSIISKNYLISLAFLETPVILTVVIAISVFDLFSYSNSFLLSTLPLIYILLFSCSAGISIFYSGIWVPKLLHTLGIHPQFETQIFMQFLIFSSAIQAPFIIFFISIFYHKYFMLAHFQEISLLSGHFVFIILQLCMVLIMQYALAKGISKIVDTVSSLYLHYPENSKHIFILLIMQIGFLQAPFIFSFICFILLFKVFTMPLHFLYYLFSFLTLCFGISGYLVIDQSSNVVVAALNKATYKINQNKSIMGFSLLSQILLDSRILYILLIILFSINFFN